MAISDQLTLLNNTKTAIRTAINNKGGSVTDSTPFADYSTAIDNLPSGGDNSTLIDLIERDITTLNIPSGTTQIGSNAMAACPSLTSVTIPSSVTVIMDSAFNSCTSLTSVTIPSSVTSIGNHAFAGCSSLSGTIAIPSSVTSIGKGAFGYGQFSELILNGGGVIGGIDGYDQGAFASNNKLNSVTIGSGVTVLGVNTFRDCKRLTSVVIPDSVTTIRTYCFSGCNSIKNVSIGSGVTLMDQQCFVSCSSLETVAIHATTPPTLGANAFINTNQNLAIYVPAASVDTYKADTNWSTYASRIYPIAQVATVDGNPVYNYDLRMTSTDTITSEDMEKMPNGTSIEFAEGVTQIGGQLGAYEEVILPNTFLSFNDTQPINAATTTLTSKATTPPSVERSNLGGSGLTEIYVPAASVDTYKAASAWSNFASIIQELPSPTPSVTSITFTKYEEKSNPADFGDIAEYDGTEVPVDSFNATTDDSTFDSDIKAAGLVAVEDNNGNDITSQCTFASEDYAKWDSTQDPDYDGESEPYYEWRLYTTVTSGDEKSPHSATITATYGNLSDAFTIEWTTTSNGEPEPEPDPEEPEE